MSLLWKTAIEIEGAARPVPSHEDNLSKAVQSGLSWGHKYHEMTPEEFAQHRGNLWHGSPNGETGLSAGSSGIHIGTREAAKQALEARIGRPAEGEWDGTREYGKTLLVGHGFGYGARAPKEPHLPTGEATYSNREPVPMHVKPDIFPVKIVGEMTNSTASPHEGFRANGLMSGQLKKGTARRGYYYTNVAEDSGSVSAVVPARSHLATHEDFVRYVHHHGRRHGIKAVPDHNLERYGIA